MNQRKSSSSRANRGASHKAASNASDTTVTPQRDDVADVPETPTAMLTAYMFDVAQRSAIFAQVLVERGDRLLEDERGGLPLQLNFPYEVILDAREFDEPAGYSLLRILPDGDSCFERCAGHNSRPVIVFDPRAGHGPGIGGFKRDSEVGMALHQGHPVYFVAHHMLPCEGQTLAHVHHALRKFVAAVVRLHPGERPALYGNCQAGWAVALLAADCAGVTGPTILNGAPLSYWGGDAGVNPMRLAGGLTGGVWMARFLSDLSGGYFDGAWLAQNFESLNPGHAHFGKYKSLFAQPEAERERFIEFERWWGEFCYLTREEIVAIVENLFIGNRLEEGGFRICDCCHADLRQLKTPMLIFASKGDNITPPQQALGWISAVWPTTEALIASGQRIVYLLNPGVGHLGIFVSSDVAKKEHRAILDSLDSLEDLQPGLYEMRIQELNNIVDCTPPQFKVHFERRRVEDLPQSQTPEAFERVRELSEQMDLLYQNTVGPWIRLAGGPVMATALKWSHPMRLSRLGWAHAFNPFAQGIDWAADWAESHRAPTSSDNPWREAETRAMDVWSGILEDWRRRRDRYTEQLFSTLYQSQQNDGGK